MKEMLNKIIEKLFGKKIPRAKHNEPRVEKDTKCDKCEYIEQCKAENIVVDCTIYEDTRKHYIVGLGAFCKKFCNRDLG